MFSPKGGRSSSSEEMDFMRKDVESWTKIDVGHWLRCIGFERYVQYFFDHEIDGEVLLALGVEELFQMAKVFGDIFKVGEVVKFRKTHLAVLKRRKRDAEFASMSTLDFQRFISIDRTSSPVAAADGNGAQHSDMYATAASLDPWGECYSSLGHTVTHQEAIENAQPIIESQVTTLDLACAQNTDIHVKGASLEFWGIRPEKLKNAQPIIDDQVNALGAACEPPKLEAKEVRDDEEDIIELAEGENDNAGVGMLEDSESTPEKSEKEACAGANPNPTGCELFGSERSGNSVIYMTPSKAKKMMEKKDTPQRLLSMALQPVSVYSRVENRIISSPPLQMPAPNILNISSGNLREVKPADQPLPLYQPRMQAVRSDPPPAYASSNDVIFELPEPRYKYPPPGEYTRAFVGYADSPLEFSIVLELDYDRAEKIGSYLNDVYKKNPYVMSLPPEKIKPGTACVSKFNNDDDWYRAVIEKVYGDQVLVRYVDYGNKATVDRRSLIAMKREKLLLVGPLSIACSLADIPTNCQFTDQHCDNFFECVDPGKRLFLVKFERRIPKGWSVRVTDPVKNESLNAKVRQMLGLAPMSPKLEGASQWPGGRGFGVDPDLGMDGALEVARSRTLQMDDTDRAFFDGGGSEEEED